MRTRSKIEAEIDNEFIGGNEPGEQTRFLLQLEVLLDIRDLLSEKKYEDKGYGG